MLVTIRMTEEYHNPEDQNPTWMFISTVGFEVPTAVTVKSMLLGHNAV
jgi:hypothetical protein